MTEETCYWSPISSASNTTTVLTMTEETCHWAYDTCDGFYESSCGHAFNYPYPHKDDEDFAYCPYCGQEIIWIDNDEERNV